MSLKKKSVKKIKPRIGIENDSFYPELLELSKTIRLNIRKLRNEKGFTQEKMQDFGLNLRQFQRIESGETKNVTILSLIKIASALSVKVEKLFS